MAFVGFLALAFFIAPIVLSIMALVRASRATAEVEELRRLLQRQRYAGVVLPPAPPSGYLKREAVPPSPVVAEPDRRVEPEQPGAPVLAAQGESPAPAAAREAEDLNPYASPPPPSPQPGQGMEVAIGGTWSAFAGIAALVTGIVFFVGYAIQHNWIGPGLRVTLGLVAGGGLVGLGYLAQTRGRNLGVLAQCLTGGGTALFYFSVFAAFGVYHLISAPLSLAGLAASAVAALALAAVYDSQAVAILALLGAFLTPQLIGGEFDRGAFPLIFVAGVNVPVLVLGLKRRWQVLYNLAFVFTLALAWLWLARELPTAGLHPSFLGLGFVLVFFAEFVALGLIKLVRQEPGARSVELDLIRLILSSLALLGAVYWIFDSSLLQGWTATAFLALALVHAGLARFAWRWLPACRNEVLVLLLGGLTFASLALPIQLDGAWVSLGWSIEGVLLAWFALRLGSAPLQAGAVALGVLGLGKSALFDFTLSESAPPLFLNARFGVGLLSALLLAVQGQLHRRAERARAASGEPAYSEFLTCAAVLAGLVVLFADGTVALGLEDPLMWVMTSAAMVVAAVAITLAVRPASGRMLWGLAVFLFVLVPVKMLFIDFTLPWQAYNRGYQPFINPVFTTQVLSLGIVLLAIARVSAGGAFAAKRQFHAGQLINLLAMGAGIAVVSLEISRSHNPWAQPLITLWWAVCALALATTGLVRRRAYLRYAALAVFGMTAIKVIFEDLSQLSGLPRIAAFMGLGVLLLILSYAYQRVAPLLMRKSEQPEQEET